MAAALPQAAGGSPSPWRWTPPPRRQRLRRLLSPGVQPRAAEPWPPRDDLIYMLGGAAEAKAAMDAARRRAGNQYSKNALAAMQHAAEQTASALAAAAAAVGTRSASTAAGSCRGHPPRRSLLPCRLSRAANPGGAAAEGGAPQVEGAGGVRSRLALTLRAPLAARVALWSLIWRPRWIWLLAQRSKVFLGSLEDEIKMRDALYI